MNKKWWLSSQEDTIQHLDQKQFILTPQWADLIQKQIWWSTP
jgi:hypothetical protein